jgi:hypothetical protein
MAPNSAPWQSGTSGKYQYHPGGDPNAAPKDAPSALHSVIIPNVNLPKVSPILDAKRPCILLRYSPQIMLNSVWASTAAFSEHGLAMTKIRTFTDSSFSTYTTPSTSTTRRSSRTTRCSSLWASADVTTVGPWTISRTQISTPDVAADSI